MNAKDIELIRKMLKKQAKLDKAIMEEYGLEELDEEVEFDDYDWDCICPNLG